MKDFAAFLTSENQTADCRTPKIRQTSTDTAMNNSYYRSQNSMLHLVT